MFSASEGRSTPEEASNDERTARPCAAPPLRAAVLAVWELLVRALSIPAYILPRPTAIFTALYRGMVSTLYIEHIATALRDGTKTLEARIKNWRLEAGGVTKWGENSEANYQDYLDFLLKNGVLKQQAKASDLITNELIEDMNKFDQAEVINLAKTYKAP
jgi:hypothetical protein